MGNLRKAAKCLSTWPPPLIPLSSSLNQAVFAKPSNNKQLSKFLETYGDSVLKMLLLELASRKPTEVADAGRIAQLLGTNRFLHLMTTELGYSSSLQGSINAKLGAADLFERYLGALAQEKGIPAARQWVSTLMLPFVKAVMANTQLKQPCLILAGAKPNGTPVMPSSSMSSTGDVAAEPAK